MEGQPKACPRCGDSLRPVRLGSREGGAYRDAVASYNRGWQCLGCALGIVPGSLVQWLMKNVPLGGAATERSRHATRTGCPSCFATVQLVGLSWGEEHVEFEQCPKCSTMLLDPGEFPKLFVIEAQAPRE